jgi:CO/xanthine dehydrogenase FAD-binding subunit
MTLRFAAPVSLEDALVLLADDLAARPVAGGTDLVVAARQGRKPLPESIVAIDRIGELAGHEIVDGTLVLGGLTDHAWLAVSAEVRAGWTALSDAASIVGSPLPIPRSPCPEPSRPWRDASLQEEVSACASRKI